MSMMIHFLQGGAALMRLLRMQCVQKSCGLHWILWHPQVQTQLDNLVVGHHPRMRLILWSKMKKILKQVEVQVSGSLDEHIMMSFGK
uniref:Uncharacterized protein n=1 Tax=Salix viminalis TaxID=40686 RepID=A0A6N2NFP4_SALVM